MRKARSWDDPCLVEGCTRRLARRVRRVKGKWGMGSDRSYAVWRYHRFCRHHQNMFERDGRVTILFDPGLEYVRTVY